MSDKEKNILFKMVQEVSYFLKDLEPNEIGKTHKDTFLYNNSEIIDLKYSLLVTEGKDGYFIELHEYLGKKYAQRISSIIKIEVVKLAFDIINNLDINIEADDIPTKEEINLVFPLMSISKKKDTEIQLKEIPHTKNMEDIKKINNDKKDVILLEVTFELK